MDKSTHLSTSLYYHTLKHCSPNWHLEQTTLTFYDLTFVLEGEAIYYVDDMPYDLKAGDGIFIPIGSTRRATTHEKKPLVCAAFSFMLHTPSSLPIATCFHWGGPTQLLSYFHTFNFEWLHQNAFYTLKCEALFHLILCEVLSLSLRLPTHPQVESMKHYIITHLSQKLTVQSIAHAFHLHPTYCGALFKKHTHMTLLHYINTMRIQQAKHLLTENDLSIQEVGENVGLCDPYYFSKCFKALTGVSPLIYRQTHTLSEVFCQDRI